MPLAHVHTGLRSWPVQACVLGLLVVLVAILPLAHASPPEPTWIAGIYDGDDLDDALSAATGVDVVPQLVPFIGRTGITHGATGQEVVAAVVSATPLGAHVRAPPA